MKNNQNIVSIEDLAVNQVYTLKLNRRVEVYKGIFLAKGKEYLLFQHLPVDYCVDGFVLLNRSNLKEISIPKDAAFTESVLFASNKLQKPSFELDLNDNQHLFHWLQVQKMLIQIENTRSDICFVGTIQSVLMKKIRTELITEKAVFWNIHYFDFQHIGAILFKNDYLNSLSAYREYQQTKNREKSIDASL